jgi:peptide/nickel transport system permease protein
MSSSVQSEKPQSAATAAPASRGYWPEVWRNYRKRPLAVMALIYVGILALIGIFAPAIAGTKPIVCYYKGHLYFPVMSYFNRRWENEIFYRDRFRQRYPQNLMEKDPNSWAIWPLVFQDPYRRVHADEWPGQPGNPSGVEGHPSEHNWFGTDQKGYDVFAQMVHGTTIALTVGFVSMGVATVIGLTVGALAGYFGGWVDILLSRVIEIVMSIPALVIILAMLAIIDKITIYHIMAVLGLIRWTSIARLVRGEFMKLKQMDYVMAARALGAGGARIMGLHILRNAMAPVMVPVVFGIASAILLEAGLSFLGFGAAPPNPSWGTLLNAGRETIQDTWWLIVFPGMAIFLTVLAYNLIGEGLQEATDPKLREAGK